MATQTTRQIVSSAPNNPEKIFQLLNLPITRISDVEVRRNGRSRVFKYCDREVYSPEIVAVIYYESLGHIASWNEGLAFLIVQEALERLITNKLYEQIEYIGIKEEARLVSTQWDVHTKQAITRAEQLQAGYVNHQGFSKPLEEDIEKAHSLEKLRYERKEHLFPIDLLLKKEVAWLRYLFDGNVSIRHKSTPEEMIASVELIIQQLRSSRFEWINQLRLPEKNGDKTDGQQKFINEWTLKFARQMIEVCDIDHLLEVLYRCGGMAPRWDLSLIDKDTKQLRFVEVKWEDKFTSYQLKDLPNHIDSGGSIELCKIITTDVVE